jgi:hypothetical protein
VYIAGSASLYAPDMNGASVLRQCTVDGGVAVRPPPVSSAAHACMHPLGTALQNAAAQV